MLGDTEGDKNMYYMLSMILFFHYFRTKNSKNYKTVSNILLFLNLI